jgi:ferric-dicitrate binding protein FerR (iron transport regulator)
MDRLNLIHRVLSGSATGDEIKELDDWVCSSESNRKEFEDIKLLWSHQTEREEASNLQFYDGLHYIQARIGERKNQLKNARRMKIYSGAVLVCILFAILFHYKIIGISGKSDFNYEFNNEPLSTVLIAVQKKYKVVIDVEKQETLMCPFTGSFYHIRTEKEIIQTVAQALNLKCTITDEGSRIYKLIGMGCLDKKKHSL